MKFGRDKVWIWLLIVYLGYTPWHDAITLGQRPALNITFLGNYFGQVFGSVTSAGAANIIWIILTFVSLLCLLIPTLKIRKLKKIEILVLGWPALMLLNFRELNNSSLIVFGNAILFTTFLIFLIRIDLLENARNILAKYGYFVLLLSYTAAIFLPMLVPLEGYSIYQDFLRVPRYRGWTGEGQPIGFGGVILAVWSLLRILNYPKLKWIGIFGFTLGLFGIYLNGLRIGLIGVIVASICALYTSGFRSYRIKIATIALTVIVGSSLFFVGKFQTKNFYQTLFDPNYDLSELDLRMFRLQLQNEVSEFLEKTFGSDMSIKKSDDITFTWEGVERFHGVKKLDNLVATNGRARTFYYLWHKSKNAGPMGMGLGFVGNTLKSDKTHPPQIGGDYFRIYFEMGWVGLLYFLIMISTLILRYRKSHYLIPLGTLVAIFLTDIVLIIPTFGYGPILLSAAIINPDLKINFFRNNKTRPASNLLENSGNV